MATNLEQHHSFHDGLGAIEQYFKEVQIDSKKYSSEKILGMINHMGPIFIKHLNDEIATLDPEKLRTIFNDPKEAKEINDRLVKWIVANANPTTQVPFVFSGHCVVESSVVIICVGNDAS